jgi:hypothetical protein
MDKKEYDKKYNKEYHEINKEKIKERKKIWYQKNKNKISEYNKKYNKDKSKTNIIKKSKNKYTLKNKEIINSKSKEYYKKNKNSSDLKNYQKEYYQKNKEIIKIKKKEYRSNNKEKINLYVKDKRKKNDLVKLSGNLRSLIYNAFKNKGYKKNSKTEEILGCSFEELKTHIESKFKPWMTWDNYGLYNGAEKYGWDIYHIKPLSSCENILELIKFNHFTNLQPLCSYYNRYVKKNLTNF